MIYIRLNSFLNRTKGTRVFTRRHSEKEW